MNRKPVVRYQFRNYFHIFRIYYLVIYCMMLIAFIQRYLFKPSPDSDISISGLEFATIITIFITGLTTFKEPFRFFVSNGVSRRRFYTQTVASLGVLSAVIAVVDSINTLIFSLIFHYYSFYASIISMDSTHFMSGRNISSAFIYTAALIVRSFFWSLFAYFAFAALGLFITVLYYRMNRTLKIAVSVGVPMLLFVGLPLLSQYVPGRLVSNAIIAVMEWWMQCAVNPLADMLSRLALAAVFAGLAFLMIRRVDVKA